VYRLGDIVPVLADDVVASQAKGRLDSKPSDQLDHPLLEDGLEELEELLS
jgi:hypothetical protein